MTQPLRRAATYADIEALPPNIVGEILFGELATHPTGTWASNEVVSVSPFEAVSISLGDLWPLDPPLGFGENPQHLFVGDR